MARGRAVTGSVTHQTKCVPGGSSGPMEPAGGALSLAETRMALLASLPASLGSSFHRAIKVAPERCAASLWLPFLVSPPILNGQGRPPGPTRPRITLALSHRPGLLLPRGLKPAVPPPGMLLLALQSGILLPSRLKGHLSRETFADHSGALPACLIPCGAIAQVHVWLFVCSRSLQPHGALAGGMHRCSPISPG